MADTTTAHVPDPADLVAGSDGATDERLTFRGPIQQLLTRPEIGALLGVAAVWILFWLVSVPFGTVGGTANYLDVAAILGIMAVPVALLMIGGEFDLSAGSMTGATAILVVLLSKDLGEFGGAGLSLHLAVPLAVAFALIIGWFNGTVVERTSLPSFIVTLGTFFVLIGGKLGMAKLFTDKVIVEGLDEADGYQFWNNIFGAGWIRNGHVWDGRDWAWTLGLLLGAVAIFLGVIDLTFQRRAKLNSAGLPALAVGTVGSAAGFILLLTTDGSGSDWAFGALTGGAALVAIVGLCLWRYDRGEMSKGALDSSAVCFAGLGAASVALALVIAAVMDATNEGQLDFLGGAAGRSVFFLGMGVMGVLAVLTVSGRIGPDVPILGRLGQGAPVLGAGISAVPAISFLVTVQAARAILFIGFAIAGVLAITEASRRARSASTTMAFVFSMLTASSIAVMAFFIRSEGDSRKIRVELFVSFLLVALIVAAMAIATFLNRGRTSAPPRSELDSWIRMAIIAAGAAMVVFAVFEFGDFGPAILDLYENEGVAFVLTSAVAKGAIVGLAVYAVGVAVNLLVAHDDGIGRPLITLGMTMMALALAAKMLFITGEEAAATQAVTRFRVSVLYYLLFAAAGTWILARTQFGSWAFAVGGNKDASRSVGVPAARTKTTLFMMVSCAAFVTGMVIAFRLNSVQSNVGDGNEFRYIIVAVVGGCLLTGGYGSAAGAALGALIWGMISQGIGFAQWNTDWRFLVLGFLLLVAVIINNYVRNRAEKMH